MPFSCPVPPRHDDAADQMKCPVREPPVRGSFFGELFCARNLKAAASVNRQGPLKPLAHTSAAMHHNSHGTRMARIIMGPIYQWTRRESVVKDSPCWMF